MTKDEVLAEFRAAGALLEGHFVLSSGLHSPTYMQCARVLMDPMRAERLCAALAQKVRAELPGIELVVSPAMGGVVVGYEMGRQLGVPAIFTERVEGKFALRRGFDIAPGTRCLMVEDVVTTGLSSRECMDTIRAYGGEVVGAASLVDRSAGAVDLGVPYVSLLALKIPTYEADNLPVDLAALPVEKPGSRTLKS
ncbi:orotate phosphoribosyltransferase [Futiania mangrovi]|uniref:Orotate phosphoribosyltransferase n=1 Tax=Futiania mangrovi TaxID=2959716 RepID=A0A9J6PHR1_9PROT|nr:orotate phosphoribosyltransferase [Futiania mangrovii]MCP1336111.1 orotate phosphoribosyltransferase [Futiania mangrovii]